MNDQIYIRLKHILDASQAALKHISGKQRKDLDVNRTILSAIVRELEIIGEAANTVPSTFRKKTPCDTLAADGCYEKSFNSCLF